MNPTLLIGQIHPSFNHEISAQIGKPLKKTNSRSRKQNNRRGKGGTTAVAATTARGEHHGLAVVHSSRLDSFAPQTLRFVLFLSSRVLTWIFHLKPIGPFF